MMLFHKILLQNSPYFEDANLFHLDIRHLFDTLHLDMYVLCNPPLHTVHNILLLNYL